MENKTQPTYKAALYIRLARKDEEAVAVQKNNLRVFARKQGFDNCMEYCDNGYNGLNFTRPAFLEMEKAINAGEINTIIMQSVSRIARDFILVGEWLERVRDKGVRFIALDRSHEPTSYSLELTRFLQGKQPKRRL